MTVEYLAQMAPMWATAALMIAWLAHEFYGADSLGFLADLAVGLAGGIAAGALVPRMTSWVPGMLPMFVLAGVGAIVAIAAQRRVWRPGSLGGR